MRAQELGLAPAGATHPIFQWIGPPKNPKKLLDAAKTAAKLGQTLRRTETLATPIQLNRNRIIVNTIDEAAVAQARAVQSGCTSSGLRAAAPNNPIPKTFARVVPEGTPLQTLGPPSAADTFVTNAQAIRGMNASQLTKALEIKPASGYHVIEFGSEGVQGIGTPVFRTNPMFTGRGITSGGLPEYTVPNVRTPPGATIRTVR